MAARPRVTDHPGVRLGLQLFGPVVLVVGAAIFVQGVLALIDTMGDDAAPALADFARFLVGFLAFVVGVAMARAGFRRGLRG